MTGHTQGSFQSSLQSESILNQVHEGMDVYTSDDEHIGEVESIYFGSVSEQEHALGTGSPTTDDPSMRDRSWIDAVADVFHTDNVPEEMRERLQRQGFIRINSTGLFASDRYATPEQIAAVRDDRVILKSERDNLLKG